jgi:hypothetical protein
VRRGEPDGIRDWRGHSIDHSCVAALDGVMQGFGGPDEDRSGGCLGPAVVDHQ